MLRLYLDVWYGRRQLVTSVDVSDDGRSVIVRTLRVDYDGEQLWGGNDPTHQLVGELDPADPDWFELSDCLSPEDCAEAAAEFFTRQVARPIDRAEWVLGSTVKCRWTLSDVGRGLVTQGGILAGPPTRVVRIVPGTS